MSIRYVEFTDETETVILSAFGSPQPWPEYYPHQGTVEDTDPRWIAFLEKIWPFVPVFGYELVTPAPSEES